MRVVNKLHGMISLAAKAGKLQSGESSVRHAVQNKTAVLLLAEQDASANTKDTMLKLAKAYALDLIFIRNLGALIGKPGRTMVALCDAGFARAIVRLNEETNHGGVES